MRAWILAAVAAMAVGQAEAATYELTYRVDYARGYFEAQDDPNDNSSWALPDAEFDVRLVFEANDPNLLPTQNASIPGLISSSAVFLNAFPSGGTYSFPTFLVALTASPGLSVQSVYMRFSEGSAGGFIDGISGVFSPYGYDETVRFKGRWILKNLDLPQVPLPASSLLLLAGIAGLGLIRRAGSQSAT